MLKMTLPSLTQPELPPVILGLLSTPGNATAPKTTAAAVLTTPKKPKDDTLAALEQALQGMETLFKEARRLAGDAQEQQVDYRRRAEQAEAEKTHLEQEANRLRAQVQALEQRVPRWVRRIFGATSAT